MSDLDRLKSLLLADERAALDAAHARIVELERQNVELAARLPGLVSDAPAEPMKRALASPVASALGDAVQRNRGSIIDALFPVIGPIIRKAIAEALRGLMRDMNRAFEHGFNLRWRAEAWRTGVPFAQVVLRHTLRYGIEHAFLIERDSGLLLHRASAADTPDLDADAVAGMLTAIGQFVRDSVGSGEAESLEAAQVGEHLLWIADGPRASLACFIRGVPPASLRAVMAERLEQFHAGIADDDIDVKAPQLADVMAGLAPLELMRAAAARDETETRRGGRIRLWPLVMMGLLFVVLCVFLHLRTERWRDNVEVLRARLLAHPGFVLTELDSRPWKCLTVKGLLDPDAAPLQPLFEGIDFAGVRPRLKTSGYLATADSIVAARARRLLAPPDGVGLRVENGSLHLLGVASADWIAQRQAQAAFVAGVGAVDWQVAAEDDAGAAARAAARKELSELADRLATLQVRFVREVEALPDSDAILAAMHDALARAIDLAGKNGIELNIEVSGSNDAPGSDELNRSLRAERARWLRDRLIATGIAADRLQLAALDVDEEAMTARAAQVHLQIEDGER